MSKSVFDIDFYLPVYRNLPVNRNLQVNRNLFSLYIGLYIKKLWIKITNNKYKSIYNLYNYFHW